MCSSDLIGRLSSTSVQAGEGEPKAEDGGGAEEVSNKPDLCVNWAEVRVVSQLRYEYAIHLMNALGQSMTRIGLDFVEP